MGTVLFWPMWWRRSSFGRRYGERQRANACMPESAPARSGYHALSTNLSTSFCRRCSGRTRVCVRRHGNTPNANLDNCEQRGHPDDCGERVARLRIYRGRIFSLLRFAMACVSLARPVMKSSVHPRKYERIELVTSSLRALGTLPVDAFSIGLDDAGNLYDMNNVPNTNRVPVTATAATRAALCVIRAAHLKRMPATRSRRTRSGSASAAKAKLRCLLRRCNKMAPLPFRRTSGTPNGAAAHRVIR